MAVPAYATDLVNINTNDTFLTGDGWQLQTEGGGGQNALTAPEFDDFIQGTRGISRNPFSSSTRGITHDHVTTVTVASGDAVYYWWKADVAQALDTLAGGGVHLTMGTSTTVYKRFYIAGSDTYALGGWRCTPIDPTEAGNIDRGNPGAAPYDFHGCMWRLPADGPSKGYPFKMDMIRHGRQVDVTEGEVANPATWDTLTAYSDDVSRRWGIVAGTTTGAELQGIVNWGTSGTACYSRDEGRSIVLLDLLTFVATDFTQIVFNNASTDVVWDSMTILSLDSENRGIITVNNNADVTITNSTFTDLGVTNDGGTNSVWDGTKWQSCDAIVGAGGSFIDCQVLGSNVAADAGAFEYNQAVDPDGELDGMTFTQGANAHHAIEFGTSIPTAITLRDMTFTDFDADTTNGAALNFLDTAGTITVTLVGTDTPTYKTAGATIVFVTNPVDVTVTTVTATGTAVGDCNVFLYATPASGSLPAEDSVTIANSGTTATVTHTGHGLATNDRVWIDGASLQANNGVHQITVTGTNTYTYTMTSSPGSSPTGTIQSSFVFLFGDSNSSTGVISTTLSIPADQSISGRARKASAGDNPKYKTAPIAGSVSASLGASFSAVMIPDE